MFFWNDIKLYLMNSFNYSLEKGELGLTQKQGIITLLPKQDKDPLLLKNWRPISLLNTDYKLLTTSIANRIKTYLSKIVGADQTGFISRADISGKIS